ncbi:unnamed protein product [Ectocarpus sp. CCAP 1310/34]|nr:unnamed protein product [Ectocarpus sp. CCAP 1310/34]
MLIGKKRVHLPVFASVYGNPQSRYARRCISCFSLLRFHPMIRRLTQTSTLKQGASKYKRGGGVPNRGQSGHIPGFSSQKLIQTARTVQRGLVQSQNCSTLQKKL